MRVYKFLDEEFGLKTLREKRLKISTLDDLNDPFELLPYNLKDKNQRRALQNTRKELARNRGILCFSADWRYPSSGRIMPVSILGFALVLRSRMQSARRFDM